MAQSFLERLKHPPVLCDGAMGTELYARLGVPMDTCLDQLNLTSLEAVREIHLDYINAGAEVLETNTFGANRVRLGGYGLQDAVEEINRRGVAIAQEARRLTGQIVWIGGAIGPLGRPLAPLGSITLDQAREAFQEQAAALSEAGADLILLETFGDLEELREAVKGVREASALPIIAQMTVTEEGRTPADVSPAEVAYALGELGVDVIGLNCSVGPQPILEAVQEMARVTHIPLAAQPNAGFPSYVAGRFVYRSSAEYMAERARQMVEAGVTVIGGCCGTTPEHVARIRDAIREAQRPAGARRGSAVPRPRTAPPAPAAAPMPPTGLQKRLEEGFVVTVEVDPPRGFDVSQSLLDVRGLLASGLVDAVDVADSPMARGRMSALAMCTLLQSRLGVETVMHLATRHRNQLALHSELLGAHVLGVRNIFVVMGDLPRIGDYPDATAVSDVTATGLIRLMKRFNEGYDLAGKPIDQPAAFFVGCAFNMAAPDPDRELRVLKRKLEAGADFILTQSVFSPETVEWWQQRLGGFPRPVLLGLLPLRNSRHAEFLHHEVPGISVPQEMRQRLQEAGDSAQEVGITMARELLQAVRPRISGVYFIPGGRYGVVPQVLQGLL